jgi:dihydrofolate synthase / folylpolyglutamate synthase
LCLGDARAGATIGPAMPKNSPAAGPRRSGKAAVDASDVVKAPATEAPVAALRPAQIESYTDALTYLGQRVNFERARQDRIPPEAFGLDRMRAMLEELGSPQRDLKVVHIAGSKGKGSVAEMTAACLTACGYATGVYTSPHLVDLRERIRIGTEQIGYASFTKMCRRAAEAAEAVKKKHGEATHFEVLTAIGLAYFAEQAVDIAVVEVGLGGRLDATNLVQPEVTAVTALQLEHTAVLGDTLDKIAREKAGIFKPGITALTIPQAAPAMEALKEAAAKVGAPLEVVGQDIEYSCRFEASHDLGPHARVCVNTKRSAYEHLPVPLKGEHQAMNCGLALAILDKLRDRGFETPERKVAEGLARTPTDGRLEVLSRDPRIVIDGAHTPDSVACLVRAIGAHLRYDSMVVIFGCAADKDVKSMLAKLALGADKIIFTKAANNPRAMEPRELQKRFAEVSPKMTQVARGLPEAMALAKGAVHRDDLICITGSFYLAGEAKKLLLEQGIGRRPEGKK